VVSGWFEKKMKGGIVKKRSEKRKGREKSHDSQGQKNGPITRKRGSNFGHLKVGPNYRGTFNFEKEDTQRP